MSDSSPFILANVDSSLTNSRVLETGNGLTLQDTGAGGMMTIVPSGNLGTLANFTTQTDFISYNSIDGIIAGGLTAGNGIALTRPAAGVVNVAVIDNTNHQLSAVQVDDVPIVPGRSIFNFTATGSASVSVTDANGKANINVDATAGATTDATYILQKSNPDLPNAQSLGDLTNGLLKVFVTDIAGGVISTAVPATTSSNNDYQPGSTILSSIAGVTPAIGTLLVGDGTGFNVLIPGATNTVLTSNGPGVIPTYQPSPSGGSVIVLPNPTPTQVFAKNTTYIPTNVGSGAVAFSLPVSPSPGDWYQIIGYGDEGWTVSQNAGQTIKVGALNTTAGTGGSIAATFPTDSIIIYCVTTTNFVAELLSGQVSVV